MHFKKHRIGKKYKTTLLTTLGIFLIAVFLIYGTLRFISGISLYGVFGFFTSFIGKDLQVDDQNHTNVLLLGVGGEGHDGEDLTDTIMIASIDHNDPFATLISIPRDLFVESPELGEGNRINKLYELAKKKKKLESAEALSIVTKAVESISKIPIHYYVKIDFQGFEKVIDSLGGVDIFIEETIDDPLYPKDGTYGYEPFYLPAGNRHLDGKTALKYVRSRHTSSDFERGYRQQKLLEAIQQKVRDKKLFTDTSFFRKLYRNVKTRIETNLSLRELASFGALGAKVKDDAVLNVTIHDDSNRRGGFLYSPLRKLYGGAYVLRPAGDDFKYVQYFMKLAAYQHNEIKNPTSLQILNGTNVEGLAGSTKMILQRFGFNVVRFGNGRDKLREKTIFYYKNKENPPGVLSLLKILIPAEISAALPPEYLETTYQSEAQVIIELGKDYLPIFNKLDIFRNVVALTPEGEPAESATETNAADATDATDAIDQPVQPVQP